MEQISFFSDGPSFPLSYDDLYSLYQQYIFEGETDDDAFTWKKIKNGRSYFFYGKKVMEFRPNCEKSRLLIFHSDDPDHPLTLKPSIPADDFTTVLEQLRQMKRAIFRSTVTETFACCNDFMACSDAKQCLHPKDRFYNGCYYRKNLESGRIFYGKNRNTEEA